MKTSVSRALYLALSSASLVALVCAGPAQAQRQGAPITYAGQKPTQPPANVPEFERPSTARITDESRIDFRYPDQSGTGFSTPSLDLPSVPTPSVSSVASVPAQLTLSGGPDLPVGLPSKPDLSFGRQAATETVSNAASAPSQPIRIASLQPQPAVSTGKPLTLSRVGVNRDAAITEERGKASVYADGFDGQPTANGEIFDAAAMTAAHPTLPLPSLVKVTNEANQREIVVRVNDRGPFGGQQILELSPRAGSVLGVESDQTAMVRVRYLGPAPVAQKDQSYASNDVTSESLPPVEVSKPPVLQPTQSLATYEVSEYARAPRPEPVQVAAPQALGNVYIQAGAFADISNAQRLTQALDRGHPVRIEEARVNGGDYFRVLVGPFPTRQDAELQRAQLSQAGIVEGFLTIR